MDGYQLGRMDVRGDAAAYLCWGGDSGRREGNVSSEEDCKEREFRQSTRQLLAWLSIVLHGDFGVGTLHAPALRREARQRAFV